MEEKSETLKNKLKGLGVSAWTLLIVGILMLLLHLCRNQGKISRPDTRDFFLQNAGTIIIFSNNKDIEKISEKGVKTISWIKFPSLQEAGRTTEPEKFISALQEKGVKTIIVGTDLVREKGIEPYSILGMLASYKYIDDFHPLFIDRESAIYEIKKNQKIPVSKIDSLIKIAREELSNQKNEPKPSSIKDPRKEILEVALEILNLEPVQMNREDVKKIRREIFASGKGFDLESATRKAAQNLKDVYSKKIEGQFQSINEAIQKARLAIHIFKDFTLIDHLNSKMDSTEYRSYLDSIFEPGISGIYLNRTIADTNFYLSPPKPKFRLPFDSIYWIRLSGSKIVERIARDGGLSSLKELGENDKITIDRFRTLSAVEKEPQGEVVPLKRGLPVVSIEEISPQKIKLSGEKAGMWILKAISSKDGKIQTSYLPDRDVWKEEKIDREEKTKRSFVEAWQALLDAEKIAPESDFKKHFLEIVPQIPSFPQWHCISKLSLPSKDFACDKTVTHEKFAFSISQKGINTELTALFGLIFAQSFLESQKSGWEKNIKDLPLLINGIKEFILFIQKENGSFPSIQYNTGASSSEIEDENATIYSILFLSELNGIQKDERIKTALKKALLYGREKMKTKINNWNPYAVSKNPETENFIEEIGRWGEALARGSHEVDDFETAKFVVDSIINIALSMQYGIAEKLKLLKQDDIEGGITTSYSEIPDWKSMFFLSAAMECFRIAKKWEMKEEKEKLHRIILSGFRFASQLQLTEPFSSILATNPAESEGGVRVSTINMMEKLESTTNFLKVSRKILKTGIFDEKK